MLQRIIHSSFLFFSKRKALFSCSILTTICVLGYGVSLLNISQSIYSVLPQGKGFESFNKLINSKKISNKVAFLIDSKATDNEELLSLLQNASNSIENSCGDYLGKVTATKPDIDKEVYSYYYTHFPMLIDSSYYTNFPNKIANDSIRKSVNATYRNLISPGGGFMKKFLLNDPIHLSTPFFKELQQTHSKSQLKIDNGVIYSKDGTSVLMYANVLSTGLKENEALYKNLNKFKSEWNKKHPTNEIDFFGAFQITVENSLQVKKDSIITVTITIVAILFILVLFYRKLIIPLYFILPAVFGGLFALGMIGFIRPNISGLSLATGAILFGIVLDYSFHFFTHLEHTKSIKQTLYDITIPLLTGSITTILAFAALMVANSVILQDFGLFATLCLVGAAGFTLIGLPVILEISSFNFNRLPKTSRFFKLPKLPKKLYPIALLCIIAGTIVMFFVSDSVQFDDDLSHLSYHSDDLKMKEDRFVGINPDKQKKIYLFATGEDLEEVKTANYLLFQKIKVLQNKNKIDDFYSTGDFLIPQKIKEERIKRWTTYWNKNEKETFAQLDNTSIKLGFNHSAFRTFKEWISNPNQSAAPDSLLLSKLELDILLDTKDGVHTIITSIVVNKKQLSDVKSQLSTINGIQIFDRQDLATSLVSIVKDDFNYLLYASALIVFFILWVIYGRIELTLLAFIPMVISWIWILGFASIFDIKFNFVNIIIATFIFGLGDDFSIFVTDGLLAKYRYGKNTLSSYKTAIFLSAFTTIIGTGVLFFAKHPAINSIAIISVLGITCILFISLIVQPILFNFFIQHRVDKKKTPITFFTFIFSFAAFFLFWLGCILPTFLLLFFIISPFKKKTKQHVVNWMLSTSAWLLVHSYPNCKINKIGEENLDFSKPSIIIANHTSFLDILVIIMLNPKLVIVVKKWVYKSLFFGKIIQYAGYLYAEESPETNLDKAKELIANGYSIMVFPEGTRTETGKMKRFHKGAFFLAQELNLDITPVLLHGANDVLPKNDFLINSGQLTIATLPRIKADDLSWGENYSQRTKSISKHFKSHYAKLKSQQENGKYLYHKIFRNYVFKGPLLEWYFKIKWKFEHQNFEFYDQLIGDRKNIFDVGCGYGYLSYFLYYRNPERKITAVDYDVEKIELAKNGYDIKEHITFESCDITNYNIPASDVIFYNDVLHYLSRKEQIALLMLSVDALEDDGLLIIRDGVTDYNQRHETTLKTEKYSASIIGFNKKIKEFDFFSIDFIKDFAEKNKLRYEMIEQSQKTSNVLFILRKI